jgi:hypothetical protein
LYDDPQAATLASIRNSPEILRATSILPATVSVTTPVDISFTPPMPTPQDEVVMTIRGWKQVADHVVDRVEVRTEGHLIFVDIYWIDAPPPAPLLLPPVGGYVFTVPPPSAPGSGILQAQNWSVEQVPRAQLTSTFQSCETTRSLGTFEPGTYVVHVTNHGVMGGDTSASFTVRDRGSSIELDSSFWPYWLLPLP